MKKPYRYQKLITQPPQTNREPWYLKLNKKAIVGSMLLIVGGGVITYVFSFYLSWGVSLIKQPSSNTKFFLEAKNTTLGSNVLSARALSVEADHFYLNIPSLNITRALVTANVTSSKKEAYFPILKESIAHYKGTSLPGQEGDVFLYGHSVLPQFFSAKDYLTIFSTLHKISIGDKITIDYGDKKYTYIVFGKAVIDTKDVEVINRSGSGMKTLTLMTCTPPGTYLKRLVVQAAIEN